MTAAPTARVVHRKPVRHIVVVVIRLRQASCTAEARCSHAVEAEPESKSSSSRSEVGTASPGRIKAAATPLGTDTASTTAAIAHPLQLPQCGRHGGRISCFLFFFRVVG
jgi:hypothetical protein